MKMSTRIIFWTIVLSLLALFVYWGIFIQHPKNVARAEESKQRFYDECLKYEPVYKCQVQYRNLTRSGR